MWKCRATFYLSWRRNTEGTVDVLDSLVPQGWPVHVPGCLEGALFWAEPWASCSDFSHWHSRRYFPALILVWRVKKGRQRRQRLRPRMVCTSTVTGTARLRPAENSTAKSRKRVPSAERSPRGAAEARQPPRNSPLMQTSEQEHVPSEDPVYLEEREAKTGVFPCSFANTG